MNKNEIVGKGKKVFLLVVFLSIFLISLVSAAPPVSIVINIQEGLNIDFPKFEVIEQEHDHLFSFHVFNISNGIELDNTTTNCSFELYNQTGTHLIIIENVPYDTIDKDWDVNILGGNFSTLGDYSILIACESTFNKGGFVNFQFEVTPTGMGNTLGFYILILVISIFFIVLGFWIGDPWIVILGTFGFYFVGLYSLLNGIVGVRDLVTTRAISIIILAVAAYISIKAGQEAING